MQYDVIVCNVCHEVADRVVDGQYKKLLWRGCA